MAVYVDDAFIPYGRMVMCHMIADTPEELVAMADRIGVNQRWLQKAGTPFEHFDVSKIMRVRAVEAGAVEVTPRQLVSIIRARRKPIPRAATDTGEG